MSKRVLLAAAGCLALIAGGLAIVWLVIVPSPPSSGGIETDLSGVTTVRPTRTHVSKPTHRAPEADRRCWNEFGGDPQRSLSRLASQLGTPTKPLWARAMGSYMEYPPSYCDGQLYVNTFGGRTVALDAQTGKILWSQGGAAAKASTPAIAGQRLIVTSHDGTVTAFDRENGHRLWQLRTNAKVESSPVALGNTVYFGVTNGRLFAVNVATGSVRWAYNTGGRINSSPSVWGNRICISTYAGSILCLNRTNGTKLWSKYFKRDFFRYESFYASPSTDGKRIFCVARSGKVYALSAVNGDTLWTGRVGSLGYTTPAVAAGRVFVGGFDGALRAYSAKTGQELWRRTVPGRILGAPVVVGKLVFFSTLEQRTVRRRHVDGKGRLADRHGQVLARHRHRPPLLLLAERDPDGVPRAEQPARGQVSGAMPPAPGGRAADRGAGRVPRGHLRPINVLLQAPARRPLAARRIAELGQQVARHRRERAGVCLGQLRSPVAEAGRRRPEQALLVRLRGDVDLARIPEHGGLEREAQVLTDLLQHALGRLRRAPRSALRGSAGRPAIPSARAASTSERHWHAKPRASRGCAHVRVTTPSGIARKDTAASRPSLIRCT